MENWCFLRLLKEITLIATASMSLQRADEIESPQISTPDDGNLSTTLLLYHSTEGPTVSDLPDQNTYGCLEAKLLLCWFIFWLWMVNWAEQRHQLTAWPRDLVCELPLLRSWLWPRFHYFEMVLISMLH